MSLKNALNLYEVSYYLPGVKGGGGGDYVYLGESKLQIREKINSLHPRKERLVDEKDTLEIKLIESVELPLKIS